MKKIFISAILAGICIGLGGTAFLSIEDKVVGALIFSVGLFTICTGKLHLFTGKICYFFDNDKEYKISLPVIWAGNLIGAVLLSIIERISRIGGISEKALALCDIKAGDSFLSLFILGFICNIFIYIAVHGYRDNPHEIGKYLSIIFGVMGFILCGSEHCVADMYYISVAGAWSVDMAVRLIIISAGNALGGIAANMVYKCTK